MAKAFQCDRCNASPAAALKEPEEVAEGDDAED